MVGGEPEPPFPQKVLALGFRLFLQRRIIRNSPKRGRKVKQTRLGRHVSFDKALADIKKAMVDFCFI
jgi:hypothetical protein